MFPLLLPLSLALLAAEPSRPPRRPSILAPSLPELTREEEAKFDEILDRFILADTGRLRGEAARTATREFEKLGPEAIPALLRGLNRAARIHHSCPVLMISKKLSRLLLASDDEILLEFARDEIGATLSGKIPHARVLQDLRVRLMLRKNYLARRPPPPPSSQTTTQLVRAVRTARGSHLLAILRELGKRDGPEALPGLVAAASSPDREAQKLARELLDGRLARESLSFLKEKLQDDHAEIRRSAVRVAAGDPELVLAIIERLTDADAGVRAEARQALVKLGKGEDFGPTSGATRAQQQQAQQRWKAWWLKQIADR